MATLSIALGGIPLGYLLARVSGPRRRLLGFLVQLPLALPPLASGVLLLFLVGYATPIGRLTGGALTDSFAGIVLAEVFVAAPFLIIAARSAFAAMDPALEGVAATLGRGPLYVFFHVCLPIARPAILSGLLLAWLRAFGEFGATVMVAYHPYSLPVYTYVAFGSQGLPAMLPVLLPTLALALAVMVLSTLAGSRTSARSGRIPASCRRACRPCAARRCRARLRRRRRAGRSGAAAAKAARQFPPRRRLVAAGAPPRHRRPVRLGQIADAEDDRRHRGCRSAAASCSTAVISPRSTPAARGIAYVPQNYGLFPHLTVNEHLRFPGSAPIRIWQSIGSIGSDCAASNSGARMRSRSASSNGSRWRARWCALPVCCCSTSRFRRSTRRCARGCAGEMLALQSELAATTILVTHDPAEAAMLADEILVFEDGRVLQSGPTDAGVSAPEQRNGGAAPRRRSRRQRASPPVHDEHRRSAPTSCSKSQDRRSRRARHVGWTVSPARVRLSEAGRYSGMVEAVTRVASGHQITLRFGEAAIEVAAGYIDPPLGSVCRFDIDPDAVRIWPLD